jgi:6,7-dimethyl-8-ribityllumazine synthase
MNIGIVVSDFNEKITSRMLLVAKEKAEFLDLTVTCVGHVPGAYDMPLMVDKILRRGDVDGVVTLGAIIKGKTKHDEVIAHSTAITLTDLSLTYKKPVSLGITGPGMHEQQAYARIRPVSERAVETVLKLYREMRKVDQT